MIWLASRASPAPPVRTTPHPIPVSVAASSRHPSAVQSLVRQRAPGCSTTRGRGSGARSARASAPSAGLTAMVNSRTASVAPTAAAKARYRSTACTGCGGVTTRCVSARPAPSRAAANPTRTGARVASR